MALPPPDGLGGWVWSGAVAQQLAAAGLLPLLVPTDVTETHVRAVVRGDALPGLLQRLDGDPRFAHGSLHLLHVDVGAHRRDYRAYRGTFGRGALQVVLDARTGACYADIDRWNPYADVVNWVGHAGEVLRGWWRAWHR